MSLKIILAAGFLILTGCPLPKGALLVRERTDEDIDYQRYAKYHYSLRDRYTVDEFELRLKEIVMSKAEILLVSSEHIKGDSVKVIGKDSLLLISNKGNITHGLEISNVEYITLYRAVPIEDRRGGFLLQAFIWPLLAAVHEIGKGERYPDHEFSWKKVAGFAVAGTAIGSFFLLDKHQQEERIFVELSSFQN